MVQMNDLADGPPHPLADVEELSLGNKRVRWLLPDAGADVRRLISRRRRCSAARARRRPWRVAKARSAMARDREMPVAELAREGAGNALALAPARVTLRGVARVPRGRPARREDRRRRGDRCWQRRIRRPPGPRRRVGQPGPGAPHRRRAERRRGDGPSGPSRTGTHQRPSRMLTISTHAFVQLPGINDVRDDKMRRWDASEIIFDACDSEARFGEAGPIPTTVGRRPRAGDARRRTPTSARPPASRARRSRNARASRLARRASVPSVAGAHRRAARWSCDRRAGGGSPTARCGSAARRPIPDDSPSGTGSLRAARSRGEERHRFGRRRSEARGLARRPRSRSRR